MEKKVSEKINSNLGENVKKFSVEKGFSKSDLVRITGLDYHTISKIERGITPDPRVYTVAKIADALGVSVNKLLNQ